ncbi:MAG: low molecular weight protein tyrosine phosphatase family protein [Nannocystaceae bacterium]
MSHTFGARKPACVVASAAMRVLFVCSRNRWRSVTAERVFARTPGLEVRSAGTEPSARVRISARSLEWADVVVAMERRHVTRMRQQFPLQAQEKQDRGAMVVLDVPDIYRLMDPELVELFEQVVPAVLAGFEDDGY